MDCSTSSIITLFFKINIVPKVKHQEVIQSLTKKIPLTRFIAFLSLYMLCSFASTKPSSSFQKYYFFPN